MDSINRFLAEVINVVNGLVALVIMIGCALGGAIVLRFPLGIWAGDADVGALLGLVVGGAIGLVIAAYICGLLALFIDMRNSLLGIANSQRKIKELLDKPPQDS